MHPLYFIDYRSCTRGQPYNLTEILNFDTSSCRYWCESVPALRVVLILWIAQAGDGEVEDGVASGGKLGVGGRYGAAGRGVDAGFD